MRGTEKRWAGKVSNTTAAAVNADVVIGVLGRGIPLGLFVMADGGGGAVPRCGGESRNGRREDEEAAVAPGRGAGQFLAETIQIWRGEWKERRLRMYNLRCGTTEILASKVSAHWLCHPGAGHGGHCVDVGRTQWLEVEKAGGSAGSLQSWGGRNRVVFFCGSLTTDVLIMRVNIPGRRQWGRTCPSFHTRG